MAVPGEPVLDLGTACDGTGFTLERARAATPGRGSCTQVPIKDKQLIATVRA